MRNISVHSFLIVLALIVTALPGDAIDGDLDPSWVGTGLNWIGASDQIFVGYGIAVQCDNKVLVSGIVNAGAEQGALGIVRFNPDGSPDTTFGGNSVFAYDPEFYGETARDIAVQPDQKIVAVGQVLPGFGGSDFVVLRLLSDGSFDTSFSGDGVATFDFGEASRGHALAIQNDGKVVVVGSTGSSIAVARLNTGGSFDTTFSSDGKATFSAPSASDMEGWDVALQPDGKIVIAGTAVIGGGEQFAVLRLNANGSVDTAFHADGWSTFDFGAGSVGHAVAIQPDGRIVVGGSTDASSAMAVSRLEANGSLDTSFSGDGKATFDFIWGYDEGWDVALQGDGKILVAGSATIDGDHLFALVRFQTNGATDSTFGGHGYVTARYSHDAFGYALALQPNDFRILVAGKAETSTWSTVYMAATRHIGIEGTIFADGFECGVAGAWSSSVGP
jgi:uncharacterized delta-60 repeat protein